MYSNNHKNTTKKASMDSMSISAKRAIFREKKSSSTSSLFLDTTMANPNIKGLIKAVAIILHTQLNEDRMIGKEINKKSELYFFSEEKYIELYPEYFDSERKENIKKFPSVQDISDFIEALYNCVKFPCECLVTSLIYIDRIIALTGLSLQNTNWRPLVFVSLIISQKLWDDGVMINSEFAYIYPFFDTDQLNTLEVKFLEMIQYNIFVKFSVYTTFYLELRALIKDKFPSLPAKPLNFMELNKMENPMFYIEEKFNVPSLKKEIKRHDSDKLLLKQGERTTYVIS